MGQPLKILFQDDFNKNLRRTVMRYVNLSTILVYRLVSEKVMARFPDYDSLIKGVVSYFSYRNSNQSSWWIMQELNYPLLFFQHEFLISPRLLTDINFSFRQKQMIAKFLWWEFCSDLEDFWTEFLKNYTVIWFFFPSGNLSSTRERALDCLLISEYLLFA